MGPQRPSRRVLQGSVSPRIFQDHVDVGRRRINNCQLDCGGNHNVTTIAAYQCRINCAEDVLVASMGKQCKEYVKHTWRFVSCVY
jgi:hypothetical protein